MARNEAVALVAADCAQLQALVPHRYTPSKHVFHNTIVEEPRHVDAT